MLLVQVFVPLAVLLEILFVPSCRIAGAVWILKIFFSSKMCNEQTEVRLTSYSVCVIDRHNAAREDYSSVYLK